jgi:hypothetical protein
VPQCRCNGHREQQSSEATIQKMNRLTGNYCVEAAFQLNCFW